MARISYPDENDPATAALRAQIMRERGGKLPNLYKLLLNSPPVAQGWLDFLTAIRQKCQLDSQSRELATLLIAVINKADYEFNSHVPHALKAGLTQQQIDAVATWEGSKLFDAKQRAVLAYTASMTRDVHVPQAIFDALPPHFDTRELTELTATIATYNLVSRFIEAVEVDHEPK